MQLGTKQTKLSGSFIVGHISCILRGLSKDMCNWKYISSGYVILEHLAINMRKRQCLSTWKLSLSFNTNVTLVTVRRDKAVLYGGVIWSSTSAEIMDQTGKYLVIFDLYGTVAYIFGVFANSPHKCMYMMTSSTVNTVRVSGHLCGYFTGDRLISLTKVSDADVFFHLRLNKHMNKQLKQRWFWTPSPHHDVTIRKTFINEMHTFTKYANWPARTFNLKHIWFMIFFILILIRWAFRYARDT